MKLSIIVPVYNMAADDKLRFCLDSLINQTIADYEIIAVMMPRRTNPWRSSGSMNQNIRGNLKPYSPMKM